MLRREHDFGSRMQHIPVDAAKGRQESMNQQLLSPPPSLKLPLCMGSRATSVCSLVLPFLGLEGGSGQTRDGEGR